MCSVKEATTVDKNTALGKKVRGQPPLLVLKIHLHGHNFLTAHLLLNPIAAILVNVEGVVR